MATLITQGAEARLYTSQWLGCHVIIKKRFEKKYRHPELDKHIAKERIKAEAKALARCKMLGIKVPTVYDVNLSSNEIILSEIKNSIQIRKYIGSFENLVNDKLIILAKKIGTILSKLHKNNIIHGDLTTSNMLLVYPYDISNIFLIDFGLSFMSEQDEDKAVDLYVLERAIQSTHPNSEEFVTQILKTYCDNGDSHAKNIILKLDEVRLRGRKKLCFG